MHARQIVRGASLILVGNALSRLLGLLRVQVIAALFGATAATSAFQTASAVPTMVHDLLIGGAISAALIPVFSDYARRGDLAALGRVAGTLATLAALALATIAALLAWGAPAVVAILGVSGGDDPAAVAAATTMVRAIAPSVVFLGLAGLATALLYARQVFGYATYSQAAFNAGIVVSALALAPALGAASLVVGVVVGSALQLLLQLPGLRGIPLDFRPDLRHPGVRRVLALYLPVALGLVVTQVGVAIDRNLAWRTGDDAVAVMAFATALVQLPLGLAATATSFAVLPALSRAADAGDESQFRAILGLGLRLALVVVVPAMVGLALVREPLIRLLLERGAFDAAATARTAAAFLVYAPQMPFWAADQILIFAFYARKDTVTPVSVGVLGVLGYVAAALLLVEPFGMLGLVAANTIQNSVHALILLALAWRRFGPLRGLGLGASVARVLIGSAAVAAAVLLADTTLPALEAGVVGEALRLGALGLIGGATYLIALRALGAPELKSLFDRQG